ncbi:MAG: PQQ-binding-like beta-propeller repeat protein [Salinivirgaceae bacterium]|jgi:hypothetical protein|nr:PQQ-binding-like beta-propeller repeat protein [Salinivirgaceae bacterium]
MKNRIKFIAVNLLIAAISSTAFGQMISHFDLIKSLKTNGKVYSEILVTSDTTVIFGSHGKRVYFLNNIGETISKFKTRGWVHASASELDDGSVAIGCYDKNVYFLDQVGNLLRKIRPGGRIFSKIEQLTDGTLVFGTNKNKIQYISPEGLKYAFDTKKLAHGGITVRDNEVISGTHNNQIYILDEKGKLKKSIATENWVVHSQPAILKNGMLAVGSYDKNLYIFDTKKDTLKKVKVGGKIHGSPIQLNDGTIVFGSTDKYIYLLTEDGDIKYKIETGGWVVSSPRALSDSTFCIGSYDHNLYVINSKGEVIDKYDTGGKIFSSPAILPNNTIVVASNNRKVHFLKYNSHSTIKKFTVKEKTCSIPVESL